MIDLTDLNDLSQRSFKGIGAILKELCRLLMEGGIHDDEDDEEDETEPEPEPSVIRQHDEAVEDAIRFAFRVSDRVSEPEISVEQNSGDGAYVPVTLVWRSPDRTMGACFTFQGGHVFSMSRKHPNKLWAEDGGEEGISINKARTYAVPIITALDSKGD